MTKKIIMKTVLIALSVAVVILVTGIIYFEIDPKNKNINYEPANSQNITDTTIRFNSDGKLKILHIADTHLNYDKYFDSSVWVIAEACDVEKPCFY